MSVHHDRVRDGWVVRWREAGRQRARRFADEAAARRFDADVAPPPVRGSAAAPAHGDGGVYAYETADERRWRIVYRQSDGRPTSRRGFATCAAAVSARASVVEQIRRGEVRATRDTFAEFWAKVLEAKRPYVTDGTLQDYRVHGEKRLLPWFGELKLAAVRRGPGARLAGRDGRARGGPRAERQDGQQRAHVPVDDARRGRPPPRHIPQNPCRWVPELPAERVEIDYLRLREIDRYLDACIAAYRPLAEFLIGTGARISEALAVRWPDVDFDAGVVRIERQRGRNGAGTAPTEGRRFRSVQIGPRLATTLRDVRDNRLRDGVPDGGWLFLCPPQRRGRYSTRTEPLPPSRKTAHDWNEWALEDAGLRDMPLHSLRHTAATAWLSTGHPLIFVQRQLGHRSITTTEEHYGHLETSFVRDAAAQTEALIAAGSRRP